MAVYTTIDDPTVYFHTQLYTGTGSLNSVTNDASSGNFKPDFLWIKNRSAGWSNILFDSSRGTGKSMMSDSTDAEVTNNSRGYVSAFNTDGFTVGAGSAGSDQVNTNGQNYVGWQWKCNGGTTASNSDGSITSTVQVNTTAGFSIVLYTGNATVDATVGHGFSSAPDVVIVKRRSGGTGYWIVSSNDLDEQGTTGGSPDAPRNMYLNDTAAAQSDKVIRAINATTVSLQSQSSANSNGDNYVLYNFKKVQGYSDFGHYAGNGNDAGPFVYTGFKPAYLMIKRADTSNSWYIFDNKRDDYQNPVSDILEANDPAAENADTPRLDYSANGFKLRVSPNALNASGGVYFYMAFAESPFVSSAGVPTTAK